MNTKLVSLIIGLVLSGCGTPKGDSGKALESAKELSGKASTIVSDSGSAVAVTASGIDGKASSIGKKAGEIQEEAKSGSSIAPDLFQWNRIDKKAESIKSDSGEIQNLTSELMKSSANLQTAKGLLSQSEIKMKETEIEIANYQDEIKELNEKVLKLEEKEKGLFKYVLAGIMGLAGISIASGIFVLFFIKNMQLGGSLIASGFLLFALAYILQVYIVYILILALITGAGFLGWILYQKYHEKKAIFEIVQTVEKLKDRVWDEAKEEIKSIQSKATKQIVNEIKLNN